VQGRSVSPRRFKASRFANGNHEEIQFIRAVLVRGESHRNSLEALAVIGPSTRDTFACRVIAATLFARSHLVLLLGSRRVRADRRCNRFDVTSG